MIPFLPAPSISLFGHEFGVFGPLVVFGLFVGIGVALRRADRTGLDRDLETDLIGHAVIIGFVLAHVLDVLAYHPERAWENPLELLRFWGSLSSFGGMLGGLFGMAVFFARNRARIAPAQRLAYVDTILYGFPFAWIFGRLACTFVFDHPGTVTDSPFATSLATPEARAFAVRVYENAGALEALPLDDRLRTMGLHNLGFYEMLYTLFVIVPVFVLLGRRARPPGFFLAAFFVVYAPIRFLLDFARMSDVRYGGLTPGQYAAILVFVPALGLALHLARRSGDAGDSREAGTPSDGSVSAPDARS